MSRGLIVVVFVLAVVVVMIGFSPVGNALGDGAHAAYERLIESSASESNAALVPLLAIDAAALLTVFVVSLVGGVKLPSGLPHLFFALFVPLSLGVMQARFFALAEIPAGLADAFGTYNFVAMFTLSIVLAQIGVHLARRRHEGSLS
ncbi:hypothetical protein EG835_00380 [bacterium]|nr:hypothetical protein [bacterium]